MQRLGLTTLALLALLPMSVITAVPADALSLDALPSYQDAGMRLYVSGTQKLQDGDYVSAVDDLKRAVRSRPDLPEAFHNLGFGFEKTGNLKGAVTAYERALTLKPNYASALNNLGFLLATTDADVVRAVQLCQRAVELEPRSVSFRDSLGWACYKASRMEEALMHFQAAIKIDPTFFKSYFNAGLCYFNKKEYQAAAQAFELTIRLNPAFVKAYVPLGVCYENTNQGNKALYVYRQALAKTPAGSPIKRHLENKVKKISDNSRSFYFQNVKSIQGSSRINEFLAQKSRSGRITAPANTSQDEYNVGFTPVSPAASVLQVSETALPRASTVVANNYSEFAAAPVATVSARSSTTRAGTELTVAEERELEKRFSLSKSYMERGLTKEAKRELEFILERAPESGIGRQARNQLLRVQRILDDKTVEQSRTHLEMGKDFFRSGKYEMAEMEFQKALRLAPETAEIYKDLALLHYNQGKLREAYEESKRAIALDRTMKEAYVVLGSLYAKKGRAEEAVKTLSRIKEVSKQRDAVDELAERMIDTLSAGS